MFLRALNIFMAVFVVSYWSLHIVCPLFSQGPPKFDDDSFIPPAGVCICLNRVPLVLCLQRFSGIIKYERGALCVKRQKALSIFNVFVLVIALSGDVELNPGPAIGKIHFAHLNSQSVSATSLVDKPLLIQNFMSDDKIDILALSETWLKPDSLPETLNSITPDGYSFMHVPRESGRGGGVAFVYRSLFEFRSMNFQRFSSFEIIGAKLCLESASYIFVNIYRPPSSSIASFVDEFSVLLESLGTSTSDIFISCDFNIHVDNYDESATY